MLAVVTTDAAVEPALLQRALAAVTDVTFNAITVDGECSTNDCVFALANGASGVAIGDGDFDLLVEALRGVCEPLAIGIVRGGEGGDQAGHRRGDRRAQRERGEAGGPRHRQFAAGQDRRPRRRSELGPADRGRRARRRRLRSRARARADR